MGDPQVIVLTRFSVYNYPSPMIQMHQRWIKSESDYLDYIYGKERLESKFAAFEHFLLPSLQAQSRKPAAWYIFTSPHLPPEYQGKLQQLTRNVPYAKIVSVNHFSDVNTKASDLLPLEGKFITVKLDDDDAFHPHYLYKLADAYAPHTILSPVSGYMASKFDFKTRRGIASHYSYPKRVCAASGLAYAQGNVLTLGDHTKIHKHHSNIQYIDEPKMFVRLIHDTNFSKPKHKGKPFRFSLASYLNPKRHTRKKSHK